MRFLISLFYPLVGIYFLLIVVTLSISYVSIHQTNQVKGISISKKQIALSPTPAIVAHKRVITVQKRIDSPSVSQTPTSKKSQLKNKTVGATQTPVRINPTSTPFPNPTNTIVFSPTPVVSAKIAQNDSISSYLLSQINTYRASKGLSAVSSNTQVCDFAAIRAREISTNFSHDGFTSRLNAKSLPYSYHEVSENIAMNSDHTQIINMWINSPGHAENMRKDTPYVCVMQNGDYYAYEGMRP